MPKGAYKRQNTNYDNFMSMIKLHGMKDECLIWPFGLDTNGYGCCFVKGKQRNVHPLALEYKLGRPILPGLCACHIPVKCHNRACFAPAHLYEATQTQNKLDQIEDETIPYGEKGGNHIL